MSHPSIIKRSVSVIVFLTALSAIAFADDLSAMKCAMERNDLEAKHLYCAGSRDRAASPEEKSYLEMNVLFISVRNLSKKTEKEQLQVVARRKLKDAVEKNPNILMESLNYANKLGFEAATFFNKDFHFYDSAMKGTLP